MMLYNVLAIGATLFVSSSLALPAVKVPVHCTFHAKVDQVCNHGYAYTSLTIPQLRVEKTTIKPNNGQRSSLMSPWNIKGLEKDFVAELKDGDVTYTYGDDKWDGQHGDKFTCNVGAWSKDNLNCNLADSRTQVMDCSFQCSATKAEAPFALSARSDSPLDDLDALSTNTIETPGTDFSASYAHGYCSFKMQLVHQCLNNTEEGWHNEMIGNLTSIQDNARDTVVSYPDGAGRIDWPRKKTMTNIGSGLEMVYQKDNVYFGFDGGRWDLRTKDDHHAYGLCAWDPWTRNEWGCEARLSGEYRTSKITCVFRC